MDTPSSQRRITRSSTRLSSSKPAKPPVSAGSASRKKIGRKVLADVTNDSPITGLAPAMAKSGSLCCAYESSTPRTRRASCENASQGTPVGENLLRSQVRLLLQKVETEIHKAPSLRTLCHINGFLSSPSRLAAPTPMNTPASSVQGEPPATPITVSSPTRLPMVSLQDSAIQLYVELFDQSPQVETPSFQYAEKSTISVCSQQTTPGPASMSGEFEAVDDPPLGHEVLEAGGAERDEGRILVHPTTRTLQFDSPEKSATEISVSPINATTSSDSSPTRPDSESDDDETSDWSVLVNVSSPAGRQDDGYGRPARGGYAIAEGEEGRGYGEGSKEVDILLAGCAETETEEELCRGIRCMGVAGGLPRFEGKHTRFVYNSDDEMKVILKAKGGGGRGESIVNLKGLPTPCDKHVRFSDSCLYSPNSSTS